jgi:hypothetical protein
MDRSLRSLRSSSRLAVVLFAAALLPSGCSGCSDKSAPATSDATAVLQAQLDAGENHATARDATVYDESAMPASSGEDLDNRMAHLLEAIAQNNPDLAADALFPRDAYVALKDVPDPQKVWDKRVSNPFRRSVEQMHKMKGIERARFVSFEIGRSIVQVSPKKREFKKPLWRVKHSKLSFTIDGKPRSIDIAEMTAWRGAWYITRLR